MGLQAYDKAELVTAAGKRKRQPQKSWKRMVEAIGIFQRFSLERSTTRRTSERSELFRRHIFREHTQCKQASNDASQTYIAYDLGVIEPYDLRLCRPLQRLAYADAVTSTYLQRPVSAVCSSSTNVCTQLSWSWSHGDRSHCH